MLEQRAPESDRTHAFGVHGAAVMDRLHDHEVPQLVVAAEYRIQAT